MIPPLGASAVKMVTALSPLVLASAFASALALAPPSPPPQALTTAHATTSLQVVFNDLTSAPRFHHPPGMVPEKPPFDRMTAVTRQQSVDGLPRWMPPTT